jgi:tRNA (guanine-N(7)-)-methyltransferase
MASKVYPVCNYRDYTPTKNPYGRKIADFVQAGARTILADADTEAHKGKWRARFQKPATARLELELGAYHGETTNHLGRTNPDSVCLGVEWKYKQCFLGAKKARDQGLRNVTHLRANMARLPWMFAQGEVDRVWMLFPDPWSKSSQNKHRLLQPGFFRLLGSLLDEGKELMLKTDHEEYSQFIAASLAEAGCFDPMGEERARANWALIPPTPFERIFLRQKLPIYSFALVRNRQVVVAPQEVQHVLSRS